MRPGSRGQPVHVWYLKGVAGDVITVVAEPLVSDAGLQLGLIDPDGEVVFDLNDGGEGEEEKIDSCRLLTTGAYIIGIAEHRNGHAEYELSVELD